MIYNSKEEALGTRDKKHPLRRWIDMRDQTIIDILKNGISLMLN